MPQKRALRNTIQNGLKIGGQFVRSRIADRPNWGDPTLSNDGLVNTTVTGAGYINDWTETALKVGDKTVTWVREQDGTVKSSIGDELTFLLIERMEDKTFWSDDPEGWGGRHNHKEAATWSGEVIAEMLEKGWISPGTLSDNDRDSAIAACFSLCSKQQARYRGSDHLRWFNGYPIYQEYHRLCISMARTKAAQFLGSMGVNFESSTLDGCGIYFGRDEDILDSKFTFTKMNFYDCLLSYDSGEHRITKYNGTNNDLIWNLLHERPPMRKPFQYEKEGSSALHYAMSLPMLCKQDAFLTDDETLHRKEEYIVISTPEKVVRLVADGCIANDEFAAEVLKIIGYDPGTLPEQPYHTELGDNFTNSLLNMMVTDRDDYYQGNRLRRLTQIASAGIAALHDRDEKTWIDHYDFATKSRLKTPPAEADDKGPIYDYIGSVAKFRTSLRHTIGKATQLLDEAVANGWEDDQYVSDAIASNKKMTQYFLDNAPSELRHYVTNAHKTTQKEIYDQYVSSMQTVGDVPLKDIPKKETHNLQPYFC